MTAPLVLSRNTLTLAGAKAIAAAAAESAFSAKIDVVIAIVDVGTNLLYLERMDGAPIGSGEIALRKAQASASFKCETKDFEAGLAAGGMPLLSLNLVLFGGGVPVLRDNCIVGAIGVSGGNSAQDAAIAIAGASALSSS
jgi:glc operon protein GlcG